MNWLGLNWLAILCAGVAYWVLGFVWYSLLFGKIWAAEQTRHRGAPPSAGGPMGPKLLSTFVSNLIAAAAMAYLLKRTGFTDMNHILKLGGATGIRFGGTAVHIFFVWELKAAKVWFIHLAFFFCRPIFAGRHFGLL